jgi:hypothetical protein
MNVKGTLIVKNETQQVSEKFAKREFVIKTAGEYPQEIQLQLSQDKCSLIDSIQLGTEIDCSINLRGRSWLNPTKNITQYFVTLEVWKIEQTGGAKPAEVVYNNGKIEELRVLQAGAEDLPF